LGRRELTGVGTRKQRGEHQRVLRRVVRHAEKLSDAAGSVRESR
jgi:hypothetical protein